MTTNSISLPVLEIRFTIAWPVWAGGYPEPRAALTTLKAQIPAIKTDAERWLYNSFQRSVTVRDVHAGQGGYQPIRGLEPSQFPANSINVTIALAADWRDTDSGTLWLDRSPEICSILRVLLTEVCRREMPGAAAGANLYDVESYVERPTTQGMPAAVTTVASRPFQAIDSEVVLLIHGIRTAATWAEMVASEIRDEPRRKVLPVRYGYFDTVRFLLPFWTRSQPIKRVFQELRAVQEQEPNARVSVIAHSFGTFALSRILHTDPVRLHHVVMCGAIVPTSFRWDLVKPRITGQLVNECGSRDIWPVLAASATWGYGPSGALGMGSTSVRDRFHDLPHSGFFTPDFVRKYWRPIFDHSQIVDSDWETTRPTPPYWHHILLLLRLRWFVLLLVGGGLLVVSRLLGIM